MATKRPLVSDDASSDKTPVDTDLFYISVHPPCAEQTRRVLKHEELFGIFDPLGDIHAELSEEAGLFYQGTRHLSRLILAVGDDRPLLLSSTVTSNNSLFVVDLMNGDILFQQSRLNRGSLHIQRQKVLWRDRCLEWLTLHNYAESPVNIVLTYYFQADFADLFEVRGTRRRAKGEHLEPQIEPAEVRLGYRGLDEVERQTRITFSDSPTLLTSSKARFEIALAPRDEFSAGMTVSCIVPPETACRRVDFHDAVSLLGDEIQSLRDASCQIRSTNVEFDEWVERSLTDLNMMSSDTPYGRYPFAGVPWFSTPFGRDGIITALECLWLNPALARGVLNYLAATQATELNSEQDAQPGKILHETRKGEMAALGEIPFGRYYGSVDSTPLFLMLASAYYERTGDLAMIESIWPQIERALRWIDEFGDSDADGFVEYAKQSAQGLVQQGWKDSHDSVFHADGRLAEPPIALCEVQGYVYAARLGIANLADILCKHELATQLRNQADELRNAFVQAFWCDELSCYALALDGQKRPCRVVSSNAGHCLMTGIATAEHAQCIVETLMSDGCFSGWGIRTVATGAARFNPMAYHNGSVWPHDNALIAYGFDRYQAKTSVCRLLDSLLEASKWVDLQRMPELFCGFEQKSGMGPTLYPVACAPQAWAAGAVFLLLQAALGMHIRATQGEIRFSYPQLPASISEIELRNLTLGRASVDLMLTRHGEDVAVNVTRRSGQIKVVAEK